MLRIKKTKTTPLHPQSNNQMEHEHQIWQSLFQKIKKIRIWIYLDLLTYKSSKQEIIDFTLSKLYLGCSFRSFWTFIWFWKSYYNNCWLLGQKKDKEHNYCFWRNLSRPRFSVFRDGWMSRQEFGESFRRWIHGSYFPYSKTSRKVTLISKGSHLRKEKYYSV